MFHAAPPRRGFTLIELMAVIAVTAVLSVVAAPLWRTPGGADTATDRFLYDLQAGRTLSLARGVGVTMPITGPSAYTDPSGDPVDLAPWKVTLAANGVIAFNGRGEPTDATQITLTGPDGSRTIILSSAGLATP